MKADEKLQALLNRESKIKAALQAEREKRRLAAQKENERLTNLVGRIAIAKSGESPEFKQLLLETLRSSSIPESEQRFLKAMHWL